MGSPAKMLFRGSIVTDGLFPFPSFTAAESETLSLVTDSIEKFMDSKAEDFRRYDREGAQPAEFINQLKELGLFALIIPEEYGGLGLSSKGYARVVQQLAKHDGSASLTIGAHSSIGMRGIVLLGNDDQKKRYLPRLATGELIAAFCLTEAGSGSDAASIKTNAKKDQNGDWILNGEKIWITNGAFAGLFTVFARTGDEITAFIVERAWNGISTGPKEDKMGIRSSATTTVSFDNVKVPKENLLGKEGEGFKVAMKILNSGRTGLGGGSVGAMKRCVALATKQATERKQFGKSISEFPLIKEKIAQMTVLTFAAESVVHVVGNMIDSGANDYAVEAAISKVFGTEALWTVSNEALQIAGGNGFMRDFPYEMIVRDARINMIFEGTNEILRLLIGLSGAKEMGGYLKDLEKSLGNVFSDPLKELGSLSEYAAKKISQYTSIGQSDLPVSEQLKDDAEIYIKYANELSKVTEGVLRDLGKDIVNQQLILKRLADTAIDIFVGVCVISRVDMLLKERAKESQQHLAIAKLYTQQAKRRINQNLRRIEKNEDKQTLLLADWIFSQQRVPYDILS